jgi:hypothetical protein
MMRFARLLSIRSTICFLLRVRNFLFLEEVRRDIGYNLIITKKFIIIVPLVEPYEVYNGGKLYLDGLAFLGYIHTARLEQAYQIPVPSIGNENKGVELRKMLARTTGKVLDD